MDRIEFVATENTETSSGVVSRVVENDCITLGELAEAFTWFLRQSGWTYVAGVTIHKEGGGEAEFSV